MIIDTIKLKLMISKLSISYLNLLHAMLTLSVIGVWGKGIRSICLLSSSAPRSSFLVTPADCLNSVLWFPNPIGKLILYAVRAELATALNRHYSKSIEDVRRFPVNIPVIKNLTCLRDPSRSQKSSSCVSELSCEC